MDCHEMVRRVVPNAPNSTGYGRSRTTRSTSFATTSTDKNNVRSCAGEFACVQKTSCFQKVVSYLIEDTTINYADAPAWTVCRLTCGIESGCDIIQGI